MKDFLSKAANAVGSAGKTVSRSVEGAIQGAKDTVRDTAADVVQAGKEASFTVEATVLGARDAALDKVAGATGAAIKVYSSVAGTVRLMAEVGVVVAAIVAPVPTAIGAALLWLLQWQLQQQCEQVDKVVADDRSSRKLERITGLLKKYGQIPETANLETDWVTMAINSRTGEVCGKVLAGEFRGRDLNELSSEDIARLVDSVGDDDTRSILDSYLSLRKARAAAGPMGAAGSGY